MWSTEVACAYEIEKHVHHYWLDVPFVTLFVLHYKFCFEHKIGCECETFSLGVYEDVVSASASFDSSHVNHSTRFFRDDKFHSLAFWYLFKGHKRDEQHERKHFGWSVFYLIEFNSMIKRNTNTYLRIHRLYFFFFLLRTFQSSSRESGCFFFQIHFYSKFN